MEHVVLRTCIASILKCTILVGISLQEVDSSRAFFERPRLRDYQNAVIKEMYKKDSPSGLVQTEPERIVILPPVYNMPGGLRVCTLGDACTGPNSGCLSIELNKTMRTAYNSSCNECHCYKSENWTALTWGPSNPQLLYNVHVSKTGGTTFWRALEKISQAYYMKFCVFFRPYLESGLFVEPEELENRKCKVISAEGHAHQMDKQYPGKSVRIITMVRDPVQRIWSQWMHHQHPLRVAKNLPRTADIKEIQKDLLDFYEKGHDNTRSNSMYDWQYKRLNKIKVPTKNDGSIRKDYIPESNELLKEYMKEFAFIGLTEYYQLSMCLLYFTFQMHEEFDNCEREVTLQYKIGCYRRLNSTQTVNSNGVQMCSGGLGATSSSEGSAFKLRKGIELPTPLMATIKRNNPNDIRLHVIAKELFVDRVIFMTASSGRNFTRYL